jgi:Tfp pilus assembly protein PilW
MKPVSHGRGFTLVETMIAATVSILMIGGLMLSSMSLQKAMHGSEVYSSHYSDQRRLIDYLARDLRRCIGISTTNFPAGPPTPVAGATVIVNDQSSLILDVPGYYQSNDPSQGGYDQSLPIVVSQNQPVYGGASGAAPPVQVVYSQIYVGAERCVCFVRQEAGTSVPILRNAENLYLQVTIAADGTSGVINVWFRAPYTGASPLVTTYETSMLRNMRLDLPSP